MRRLTVLLVLVALLFAVGKGGVAQTSSGTFENSMVLAPLFVQYLDGSAEDFAREAQELKKRIGSAPYVKVGFGVFLGIHFPDIPLSKTLDDADMASSLNEIEVMVNRARDNGIITHIAVVSAFFHSQNDLRYSAVKQDVRNAQWFSDGLIAAPADLHDPDTVPRSVWVTPSRSAQPLHTRIEEGVRIIARRIATRMQQNPNTLLTISGDGEVEFSFERNFNDEGGKRSDEKELIYADYSPFMVEEFRDWLRNNRYNGDLGPDTDDNGDGHTLNRDFNRSFRTWKLRYFDSSGPIPFAQYVAMSEKLPTSGPYSIPDGFDAPRVENEEDAYWKAWMEFRKKVIGNWIRDFAVWMTTTADPDTGFTIPPSRFYSHQIPADFIFGQKDNVRLKLSASYVETTIIDPVGSTGVTAFNGYDGKNHVKTATPALFSALFMTSDNWGILEYNPSVPYSNDIPPSSDQQYYLNEMRLLYSFRPHVIVPALWSNNPDHRKFSIKGAPFERALRQLVHDIGDKPWFSWRKTLR